MSESGQADGRREVMGMARTAMEHAEIAESIREMELDDAEAEREKLRTELIALARHVERGDRRGAYSLALEALRQHDPAHTDTEAEF